MRGTRKARFCFMKKFVARLPLKFCVHISSLIELFKEREREKDFSIGTYYYEDFNFLPFAMRGVQEQHVFFEEERERTASVGFRDR